MRETAGGILGQLVGRGLEHGLGLLGATVLMLVLWLGAVSLATGVSWLAVMDRVGRARVSRRSSKLNALAGRARIWLEGRRAKQERARDRREEGSGEAEDQRAAYRADDREGRGQRTRAERERERERQVPLFEPAAVQRAACAVAARRCAAARGRLFGRSARGDVAARRDQAQRFRRRGRGRGRASRARSSRASSSSPPRA